MPFALQIWQARKTLLIHFDSENQLSPHLSSHRQSTSIREVESKPLLSRCARPAYVEDKALSSIGRKTLKDSPQKSPQREFA
jgi:hypothetical protein